MRSRVPLLIGLFLQLLLADGFANLAEQRAELESIRQQLDETRVQLDESQARKVNISRELGVLSATLQRISRRITRLQSEREDLQREISTKRSQVATGRRHMDRVRNRLEERLVALYKEGRSGPLKILFSAQSPTEMMQQYHYLTRILEHDRTLLAEYRQVLNDQQQQLRELEALEQNHVALLEQQRAEQETAQQSRILQRQLLQRAERDQEQLAGELADLKERAARLERLIQRVNRADVDMGEGGGQFSAGQKNLSWPVDGEILIGFGTQKDPQLGTYYDSHGIEISAPPGSPVRAVAPGKVVFADYFKGYGNLFIIQHPGGYHTLYAQTDRMKKKLGDRVKAGDLLGYSGLNGRRSIYFEVRAQGAPVDPLTWLRQPPS